MECHILKDFWYREIPDGNPGFGEGERWKSEKVENSSDSERTRYFAGVISAEHATTQSLKTMSLGAEAIAQTAKAAFDASQLVTSAERTHALLEIRKELEANKDVILRANGEDMAVRFTLTR